MVEALLVLLEAFLGSSMWIKKTIGTLMERAVGTAPSNFKIKLFRMLAADLGVNAVIRMGSNGAIEGSLRDDGLFMHYLRDGEWASDTTRILTDFFNERGLGTYIDIGASIGLTLIPMARIEGLRCIGIEASPLHFSLLQRNLLRAGVDGRVSLHNVAVFDKSGPVCLEVSDTNYGDNRVRSASGPGEYGEETRGTLMVNATRIDNLIPANSVQRPLAIKMDIQGSEPCLFIGGPQLMDTADLLLTEFWPYGMVRLGYDAEVFLEIIRRTFRVGAFVENSTDIAMGMIPINDLIDHVRDQIKHWNTRHFDLVLAKERGVLSRQKPLKLSTFIAPI